MTVFDLRIEIQDLDKFEEIKQLFRQTYPNKEIYEIKLLNVD